MENKPNNIFIKIAKGCFVYSLIIGTLIFLSYCISGDNQIAIIGFFYLHAAVVINITMLFILLLLLITEITNRLEFVKAIGLLLVNIPIAFFYLWVVSEFPQLF